MDLGATKRTWRQWACTGLPSLIALLVVLCLAFLLPSSSVARLLAERVYAFHASQLATAGVSARFTQRTELRAPPAWLPPPPPPSKCNVAVRQSPFERSCTRIERACVDQGRLILYDRAYRPFANGRPLNLPVLKPGGRQSTFYLPYYQQRSHDQHAGLPPIHVRTASAREPRRYLADPHFSNCTVPVVYYQFNSFNFAHVLRDNAARMYSALQETPWASHARLVLMTGEGLPISEMARGLYQPLSALKVTSWAEFSTRLPDGQVGPGAPPAAPGELPPSVEGSEQRCFRTMYVCLHDVHAEHYRLHGYGRHVVRYYGQQQGRPAGAGTVSVASVSEPPAQQAQQAQRSVQLPPVSVLRQLGAKAGRPGQVGQARGEVQIRVMFGKRTDNRYLLNVAELLRQCNAWRYRAPSGATVRAACWEAATPTLQSGISEMQRADVLVGAHGANLANGFFLRPGSSVIELTMHEFEELSDDAAHANFLKRNVADDSTQLQWWKLLLCSSDSWAPGLKEAAALKAGSALAKDAPKYRDLIVRWEALQTALQAVVNTAGDMGVYRARVAAGRWWWLSTNSTTVPAGPNILQTCRKARRQGLIP